MRDGEEQTRELRHREHPRRRLVGMVLVSRSGMATTTTPSSPRRIGQLCVGGDWACSHGDLAGLRFVARELANATTEPLHDALLVLADECYADPNHAIRSWVRIRKRMLRG